MTKKVSSAEAKARLPEFVSRVAYGGERFIIERRGKPMAALVPVEEVQEPGRDDESSSEPKGALGLVGLLAGYMTDEEIDEMTRDIYEARDRDVGRPVHLEPDVPA
jgi:prevent-host-death family protein